MKRMATRWTAWNAWFDKKSPCRERCNVSRFFPLSCQVGVKVLPDNQRVITEARVNSLDKIYFLAQTLRTRLRLDQNLASIGWQDTGAVTNGGAGGLLGGCKGLAGLRTLTRQWSDWTVGNAEHWNLDGASSRVPLVAAH